MDRFFDQTVRVCPITSNRITKYMYTVLIFNIITYLYALKYIQCYISRLQWVSTHYNIIIIVVVISCRAVERLEISMGFLSLNEWCASWPIYYSFPFAVCSKSTRTSSCVLSVVFVSICVIYSTLYYIKFHYEKLSSINNLFNILIKN